MGEIASAATPIDLAWLVLGLSLNLAGVVLGVIAAIVERRGWAYALPIVATLAGIVAPALVWLDASEVSTRFGGGATMITVLILPAARVWAALGLVTTAVAASVLYAKPRD